MLQQTKTLFFLLCKIFTCSCASILDKEECYATIKEEK